MEFYKNRINQIKAILGVQVKLASMVLGDGTKIECESYEVGYPVFALNEDGTQTALKAGSYKLDDGTSFEVDEEGKIAEISAEPNEAEEDAVEAAEGEAKMEDEAPAEGEIPEEEEGPLFEKIVEAINILTKEIEDIKSKLSKSEAKWEKLSKKSGGEFLKKSVGAQKNIDPAEARFNAFMNLKNDGFFGKQ